MKFKKNVVVSIFFIYFLQFIFSATSQEFSSSSQLRGLELSNNIYSFLKKEKFSPETQSLINNGNNTFPYNIFVTIKANGQNNPQKINKNTQSPHNLLIIFPQEQTLQHQNIILQTLNYTKQNIHNTNVIFLFSYGDKQTIEKQVMIYGSKVFVNSINTNEDYTALYFDFESSENKLITNSNGKISPSHLIVNEFNIFSKEGFKKNLPLYVVSQMNSLKLFEDKQLDIFFEENIPAIKLCLNQNIENEKKINIISNSIKKFDELNENERSWEKHFIIFYFFGRYINLGEASIIRIIITLLFVWVTFIFILGLINFRIKNSLFFKLKKIWFTIPLTFLLTYLCFLTSRIVFSIFATNFSSTSVVYFCGITQLCFSFLIVTLIYVLILLFNFNYTVKTIDFLLVISCFINQAFFIFLDISLFPLFLLIFILSIIAYFIKNNPLHILIFIMMILILGFYANQIIEKSSMPLLKSYILNNSFTPFTLSLIIYPVYLLYLRLLTSFRLKHKKNTQLIILSFAVYIFISIVLVIFALIRVNQIKNRNQKNPKTYTITESTEDKISFNYSDKIIFTDIIRTIEIDIEDNAEVCDVRINSTEANPVLYSDNEFDSLYQTSALFIIPENPPSHLTFSYGSNNKPCNIVISALYAVTNAENEYKRVTKVISIGE